MKVEEPAIAYGYQSSPFEKILKSDNITELDDTVYMEFTRKGIPKSNIKELADYLEITQEVVSGFLHTSLRNLQRKDDGELLDTFKSERLLELASLSKRAIHVLGSREALVRWLQSPILALNNKKPVDYLDTTFGINILFKILGRIEQGVYS